MQISLELGEAVQKDPRTRDNSANHSITVSLLPAKPQKTHALLVLSFEHKTCFVLLFALLHKLDQSKAMTILR